MKRQSNIIGKYLLTAFVLGLCALGMTAQNSLPAPGSGGSFQPNPSPGFGPAYGPPPGSGWYPGPGYPGDWGSPWNPGWNYNPTIVVQPTVTTMPSQGVTKVISCGYDAQGVWRVVPLTVSYQYNGTDYSVYVLNAWNPWTDQWDRGVDVPAYSTDYYLRGVEYSYYAVLPTGTFYFNL